VAILAADHAFHEKLPKTFPHFPGARDLFAADDAMRGQSADLNATLQVAYVCRPTLAKTIAGEQPHPYRCRCT